MNRRDPRGLCITDSEGNYWDNGDDVAYDWGAGDCDQNPEWLSMANGAPPGSIWLNGGQYYPPGDDGPILIPVSYPPPGAGSGGSFPITKLFTTGVIPCSESASGVISSIENNFSSFGNFQTTAWGGLLSESVTFSPPSVGLALGESIPITVAVQTPGWLPNYTLNTSVTVTSVSANSFTFSTVPGHLLYPANITFSAQNAPGGGISFGIALGGALPLQNLPPFLLDGSSFENKQWQNFLSRVETLCGST